MIFAGLVAVAVMTQLVIAKSWVEEDTTNLLEAGIWYATSILNVVVVGRSLSKSCIWLYMTRLRPEIYANYRYWSMEQEVEDQVQAWLYWPALLLLVIWSLWTLPIVVTTLAPIITDATGFLNTPGQIVLLWLAAFLASIVWVLQEQSRLDRKRRDLEVLRPTYHQRFPVSELLSMYECLRVAPRAFWEEYKNLPDVQVSEATNRKFRERAAPYSNSRGNVFQRRSFTIAVLAVLAAVFTFAEASIDGGLLEWFVRGLTK